jgi:hypothetical protein
MTTQKAKGSRGRGQALQYHFLYYYQKIYYQSYGI